MAFKLLIKKSVNALNQTTLDLGELGLRYTVDGSSNVTGGQLYVGLGSTNTTGYAAVSMVGHTHSLQQITLNGSGGDFVAGDIIYASGANSLVTLAKGTDGQVLSLASGVPVWTSAAAVNNGTLALTAGSGATNTSVSIGTGTGFSANTASNLTYTINVGPAISALSTTMTGAGTGFLRKNGADTYSLDTNTYVVANSAITGATATKITFDAKGLVTAGTTLAATDIPNLDAAKITSGAFDAARIPNLDASKINAGTFDAARIPTLDIATKTSGTLAVGRGGTGATTLTAGSILVGNGTGAITAPYTVETTLTGGTTAIPRADAVKTYIDGLLNANDAMQFKGTIGTGGTVTALPTTYSAGWTFRVITAGTYAGVTTEIGDLIIAVVDRSGTGNLNSDWTVVQTNIDGAVVGPASSVDNRVALFNGTSGKLIKDSGALLGNATLTAAAGTGISLSETPTFTANATVDKTITITNSAPNATHTGDVTGATALTIANDAVTFAKMQNIDTARMLGRVTASTGDIESLTAAQVRTFLNVADGATANTGTVTGVTGTAPIVSSGGTAPAISISAATTAAAGSMSAADKTKLDGIASGATANTGTVTSVSGTGTVSGLSLSGTVTTSGNLTLGGTLSVTPAAFGSQTANTVLAAPNGSAGNPTFRALLAADIPNLDAGKITTGTLPVGRGGTGATTHTSGNVLIGAGTGAITSLSRSGIDTRTTFPATAHAIASATHTAGAFKMFASNATAVVEIDAANTSIDPFILVNTGTGSASQVPVFANTLDCGTW
jgi:hypothetical protein